MKWYWWYVLIDAALTVAVLHNEPMALLFGIPLNILLHFLPVWAIVSIVRRFRKQPTT